MRIAVDVGGTFTDVIVLDEASQTLRLEKVETTPHDPATGVLQGFHKANATLGAINYFVHGTTLGLNALLTRRGAKGSYRHDQRVSRRVRTGAHLT